MKLLPNSNISAVVAATLLTLTAIAGGSAPLFADSAAQKPATRIVAIGGAVTEVVFALGQEDRLVARDTTSVYPEKANDLPNVGYIRALSPEGVMSVDPDLILMLEGSGPQESVDVLKKSGIPIADIPEAYTAQGILDKVRAVGTALGASENAEALASKLDAELSAAEAEAKSVSSGSRVLFILSTQGGRILASGTDTAAHGILELSGAQNAISDFSGYKQLSDEAILSANPDVILMMRRTGDHGTKAEDLFKHPALALTPAGKNKRLIVMPGQYLLGFGPRTAGAIRDLSKNLAQVGG
ncbi:MAG: ABC transporter substrate-binding protein [Roseibium sp.]